MTSQPKNNELQSLAQERAPQGPAAAFERFINMMRTSSAFFDADPDTLLSLVRPFLVNPVRDEVYVREIASAYGAAVVSQIFRRIPLLKFYLRLITSRGKLSGTMEQFNPNYISRLRSLEEALKTGLRPGSIALNLKPVRYVDTPTGYGTGKHHRYRIEVQTLIESLEDALQAVAVELSIGNAQDRGVVDQISPQAGFSTVGLKRTAGMQVGIQYRIET